MDQAHLKKIVRRIVNFLHQYATAEQILAVAKLLGIKTEP